jgi:predicted amidohydrolase YtcJ
MFYNIASQVLRVFVLSLLPACALSPAAFAQRPADAPASQIGAPADLVLLGGNIITMDADRPRAEAVAARSGRIVAVGADADVRKLIGPGTRVIELAGRTVVPGFVESHGHFVGLGESKQVLDLTTADSWDTIIAMVRSAAERTPPGEWIVGRGWHQEKWRQRPEPSIEGLPVHDSLSRATPRNPVLLTHASGHMSFVNELALNLANITVQTPNPEGGEIVRQAGEATGALRETAQRLVSGIRDANSQQGRDIDRSIDLATAECLKYGITSFQDAGSSLGVIARLRERAEQGRLGVRLWVMIRDDNARIRQRIPQVRVIGAGEGFLTVRAIKRTLDGALGSHGAWLLEPYADMRMSTGLQTVSLDSLRETAQIAAAGDMQLCVHAIGDRANREALNVFEATFAVQPSSESRRWRIEHAQHLHPDDIPRFAKLGVIASMQGVHCTSDAVFVPERLGEERSRAGAYVWQSLLKSGAVLCNGTDAPVERVDPLPSFYASVTRKLADGRVFYPDQRMTREQALRSYTLDAAYAAFEEDVKGSLVPGKLADMAVLSRDILACDDEEIISTQIVHTIVGGKIAYSAAGEAESRN